MGCSVETKCALRSYQSYVFNDTYACFTAGTSDTTTWLALPQGDITALGVSGSGSVGPSFGKAGEVVAVGIGDCAQGLPRSLDVVEPPHSTAFKGTVVLEPSAVHKARSNAPVGTERSSDLGDEHYGAEEGELSVRGYFSLSRSSPPFAWLV